MVIPTAFATARVAVAYAGNGAGTPRARDAITIGCNGIFSCPHRKTNNDAGNGAVANQGQWRTYGRAGR